MSARDHKVRKSQPVISVPLWRARFVLVCIMLAFVALIVRALQLQGLNTDFLQAQGEKRYHQELSLPAIRGKIFDRSGKVVLASSVLVKAIWANPQDSVRATDQQLGEVGAILNLPLAEVKRLISRGGREFAYLKRQVELDVAEQILALKVPGIHTKDELRRSYPEGETVSQIVGITDIDGEGKEGIELAFNSELAGQAGSRKVLRDRLGRVLEDVAEVIPPKHGQDIYLSLDAGMQYDTFMALEKAMTETNAKAASAIVADVQTGEILALVNLPTYDPSQRQTIRPELTRNRALTDTFEPGSTMKPFTVALALDIKRIGLNTKFNTGNGSYRYQGHTISDVSRNNGVLDAAGIIRRSSNIGMTMISEILTSEEMWQKFTMLGFGRAPQIGFPGAVAGRLRPWDRWRPIERATMAYGYGLSVSLMQMAQAFTVFARNGDMVSLSLIKRDMQPTSIQVFRPEVALAVRHMLEDAAGPEGARLAQVQGYRVAGKSGTARKIVDGKYSKSLYRGSFVGFAPVSNPRIVVAVSIDEPKGHYYGGRIAAPVFADIVANSLRRLEIEPDEPVDALVALGADQEKRQ